MSNRILLAWMPLLLLFPTDAFSQQAEEPQKYTLRYKFESGQVLDFEQVRTNDVRRSVQGQTLSANYESTSVQRWKVVEVEDEGDARIEVSTQSLRMRGVDGKSIDEFDSEDPEKQPERFKEVAEAIGKPLSMMHLSPHGEVLGRKRLIETSKIDPTVADRPAIPLPDEPVAIGQSWNQRFEVDMRRQNGEVQKIPIRQSFTLQKVEGSVAFIESKTVALTPLNEPQLELAVGQLLLDGTMQFDLQRGQMLSRKRKAEKTVIGFDGPGSSIHVINTITERLVPEPATANVES